MFSEFSSRKKILELLTVGMALGISGADFDIKFDSNPDKIEPLLHSFESIPNVNILPLNLKDFLSYPLKYRYWKKLSQDLENSFDLGAVDLLFKFQELNGKLTLRLSDFLSELNN